MGQRLPEILFLVGPTYDAGILFFGTCHILRSIPLQKPYDLNMKCPLRGHVDREKGKKFGSESGEHNTSMISFVLIFEGAQPPLNRPMTNHGGPTMQHQLKATEWAARRQRGTGKNDRTWPGDEGCVPRLQSSVGYR